MSRNPFTRPTTPALSAFLSGRPVEPIGYVGGRAVYPIAGGAEGDEPQRPEDIPEETWDALGDPGKQAIVREREKTAKAEQQANSLRAELAKNARPGPPRPGSTPAPQAGDQQPDIEAIVTQAVAAALKPFEDREQERVAGEAAEKVVQAVRDAAASRYIDPSDALGIDLTAVVGESGKADPAKIARALDKHLEDKPHLAKGQRTAPALVGGAPTVASTATAAEQVKARLAEMQAAAGVRVTT
jgi:hypothetical protein